MRKITTVGLALGLSIMHQVSCADSQGSYVPIDPHHLVKMSGNIHLRSATRFLVRDNIRYSLDRNKFNSSAEIAFTYEGPAVNLIPLTSGEMRRQVGLKLRAANTCNVVYVMWHIAPDQGIFVLVKNNPGMSTNEQCGDKGYFPVKGTIDRRPEPIVVDHSRVLRATIDGNVLTVNVDGELTWQGILPAQTFTFDGPVGIRTDNVNMDVEFRVPQ